VKNEVSDMAIGIAEAVIERDINRAEHEALIDEFIRSMNEV
jgi:F0F1-type ATP synthase membrane subunit b/b'